MNIEGLGESLIDQLIEQGLVHDYADLYHLTAARSSSNSSSRRASRDRSARVPRKLGKVGTNLVAQIERSKTRRSVAPDLRARHPARRRTRRRRSLAQAFGSMDASRARRRALQSTPEIGPVVAASVRGFADEPRNRALVDTASRRRRRHGSPPPAPVARRPARWRGKTFVLTGTLSSMSREQATAGHRTAGRRRCRAR